MAPPSSHRVEDPFDDESTEGHRGNRGHNTDQERPSTSHPRSPGSHHYPGHPYGMPPYYGPPVMYYSGGHQDPYCHHCSPTGYGHPGFGHEPREQLAHYHPQQRDIRPQQAAQQPQPLTQPTYQPHYVAVNVQNDVKQAQLQAQHQAASNKQISLKEKIINNTTKALDTILDKKVLLAALVAIATPRFLTHFQTVNEKKKRKGITLNLGFGGF